MQKSSHAHQGISDSGASREKSLLCDIVDLITESVCRKLLPTMESMIKKTLDQKENDEDFQLLSREKASKWLQISLPQLDRLVKNERLPVVWIDRRPRFRMGDLKQFIRKNTQCH